MKLYSYTPQTSAGANGTSIRYLDSDPGQLTEVGVYSGRSIVVASDAATPPAQPAAIDWREEPMTDGLSAWFASTRYASLLADTRVRKHEARLRAMVSTREHGFEYNGYLVASDTRSQVLILGVANLARAALADGSQAALDAFSAALNGGWRGIDGHIVATSASAVVAMELALGQHIAQCDAVGQSHKAAINAAETITELDAVNVAAGYPGA